MGELENKIKDIILKKYTSIRAFSLAIEMPYSTIDTILKRGIDKASVSSVYKVANALGFSIDELFNIGTQDKIDNGFSLISNMAGFQIKEMNNEHCTIINNYTEEEYRIFKQDLYNIISDSIDEITLKISGYLDMNK